MTRANKYLLALAFSILMFFASATSAEAKSVANAVFNQNNLTLVAGDTYDINVENAPSYSCYSWKGSNEKVAHVNKLNGIIKSKTPGHMKVSCNVKYGKTSKTLTCVVNVVEKPIFFQQKLSAHALGGINGQIYTNSSESMDQSISNGFSFLETDVRLTSDGKIVCTHEWSKKTYQNTGLTFNPASPAMSYATFMGTKIDGSYTPIDPSVIASFMLAHPNLYFEIDMHSLSRRTAEETTTQLCKEFNYNADLLNRLLIQVSSKDMFYGVTDIYHFRYYQFILSRSDISDIDDILAFCRSNKFVSVAAAPSLLTHDMLGKFNINGLCVLAYTVDNKAIAQHLLNSGADTVCTNFLTPNEMT